MFSNKLLEKHDHMADAEPITQHHVETLAVCYQGRSAQGHGRSLWDCLIARPRTRTLLLVCSPRTGRGCEELDLFAVSPSSHHEPASGEVSISHVDSSFTQTLHIPLEERERGCTRHGRLHRTLTVRIPTQPPRLC